MPAREPAFSLVELVIVIVVIGLLAAIALPRFGSASHNATVASLKAHVSELQKAVDMYHAEHSAYPPNIDPDWFISQELPAHTWSPTNPQGVETDSTDGRLHPESVVVSLENGWNGYWYNPTNGVVRARVTYQGTNIRTLALYRRINGLAP